MNSIAHAGYMEAETSLVKMRADSRERMGRTRLPPAKTLYRIALCIEAGRVVSGGKSLCNAASTACKSSSKNAGSFIVELGATQNPTRASGFVAFGFKWFSGHSAVGLFEQDFDLAFGFFELLLTFVR